MLCSGPCPWLSIGNKCMTYIHENIEADLISSKLSSENVVNMVISEDMDHLTNGTKYLIRDFNVNNNVAKCYDLEKIKEKLSTQQSQVKMCLR